MKYFALLFFSLSSLSSLASYSLKESYSLFKDKSFIDNRLHVGIYESFIEVDLNLTSDAYLLSEDLSEIGGNSSSSTDKALQVSNLLNENRNSQNFIDLNSSIALPIRTLIYKKYRITPTLFYNLDLSSMFAIAEFDGASDLSAQVYMRKETRVGASFIITKKRNKESLLKFNLFYMKKADTLINQTASDLVNNKKFYDFGTLNQGETSVALDLIWKTTNLSRTLKFEVIDLKLITLKTDRDLVIKNSTLFHTFYQYHTVSLKKYWFEYFIGSHYRSDYTIVDGLYIGTWLKLTNHPFRTSVSLSKQFLTFTPEYKRKNFFFNYKLKYSHLGDIDGISSPPIHSFNSGMTF
ncbi:hypothetical protein A9Q84_03225 [Halobacteriovorax marinus]|uniref:Uncharacterized protein n=1 Tax=Halobacteriovorax marinus TaxID=97084 RepID=A0A1Y5FCX5_9BACT|nr:hypothetical protein A9Q84_03225 [Halobacteriovorax marinus]